MAMDATPNAIWRLRSGERTQPSGPTRRRARLRRHFPHTDRHTPHTYYTHVPSHTVLWRSMGRKRLVLKMEGKCCIIRAHYVKNPYR